MHCLLESTIKLLDRRIVENVGLLSKHEIFTATLLTEINYLLQVK